MNKIDSFKGPYAFLSNFYPLSTIGAEVHAFFGMDKYPCLTVEHGYQAMKSKDLVGFLWVLGAPSPGIAKRHGRSVKMWPDWDSYKLEVMYDLLRQKFSSPMARRMLIGTGDAELVEGNQWGDTFWGICNSVGENWLGRILMQVRDEIR